MKKKVVRLTEEDLVRIVKKIINEQNAGDEAPLESLPKEIQDFVKRYNLQGSFNYASVNGKIGERFGYNKGNIHSDTSVSDIQIYEKNKGQISKCQERKKFYNETFNKLTRGNMSNDVDPKMAEMCKRYPNDPSCKGMGNGKKMDERAAQEKAMKLTNQKFPNMGFCNVTMKVQKVINMG